MTAKRKIRCAIYTRKSTEEGLDQEYNTLEAQRDACAAYIRSQAHEGWTLLEERFDDGGYSGGVLERPALTALMKRVRARHVDVIVVYKIDRLTRSLADFARLVEILDQNEASFVSVTQQFNTTSSMGRLTLNVLLSFAQFEREVTSERIRDKIAASKRKGLWMGGYPPLGYDVVDRRLIPNPEEARSVERIFRIALKARSLTRAEDSVRREGICAKRWTNQTGTIAGGGPLTRSSLARLLRNPVYIGKVRQGGTLYDGAHPAIISEELWSSVQTMLDDARQARRPSRNGKSGALLSGLLYDDAGHRMVPSHTKRRAIIYRYYVSFPLIRNSNAKVGSLPRVSAPRLEDIVVGALSETSFAPPGARAKTLLSAVENIVLSADSIEIRLQPRPGRPRVLHAPADLKSAKGAKRLVEANGQRQPNDALIKAIALAFRWRALLENGEAPSIARLAAEAGYSERYGWKVLRLSFLAPDIVEAILEGRQPPGITLHRVNAMRLSGDWGLQRRALGF